MEWKKGKHEKVDCTKCDKKMLPEMRVTKTGNCKYRSKCEECGYIINW